MLEREADRWLITRHAFLGDNLSLALADACDGGRYATLDLGHFGAKLQASSVRPRSWTA